MLKHSCLCPSKKAITTLQTVGIIGVIVVAVVIGSAYYLFFENSYPTGGEATPTPTETPPITPFPSPTPSVTPTPTPTSRPSTPTSTPKAESSTTAPTTSSPTPTPAPTNATITPSPSPESPTLTPTPVPTEAPTATPSPVPTAAPVSWTMVDLGQAVLADLVEATISGDGLTEIDLTLQSKSADHLEVTIPAGTLFQAQSAGVQNMIVTEQKVVYLESPDDVVSEILDVACASMELDQPESTDSFTISSSSITADLGLLLNYSAFADETFRVKQFAIWTITDNPPRDGYVELGSGAVFSGPSDAEIARIRTLFVAAGISTEKYTALQ